MLHTKVIQTYSIKVLDTTVTDDSVYVQGATRTILPRIVYATYNIVFTDRGTIII